MECMLMFFLIIFGIFWLVENQKADALNHSIRQAFDEQNYEELKRLQRIKHEREQKAYEVQRQAQADQKYLDAMFVLDAAEQGIFFPGGEQVFDQLEEPNHSYDEDYSHDYENDDRNEYYSP